MKASFIFTLLFSIIVTIAGQSPIPEGYWIATESKQLKDDGIFPMDGMVINFKSDSIWTTHVFYDSVTVYDSRFEKNQLFLNHEKWSTIKYFTEDSLIMEFSGAMQVKFLPIINSGKYAPETGFWTNSEYTGYTKKGSFDLMLTDEPWGVFPIENTKLCIMQIEDKRYKGSNTEKWNLKVVNGMHLVAISDGHFEPQLFLVQDYSGDTAKVAFLSNPFFKGSPFIETFSIVRKPIADEIKYQTIKDQISDRLWRSLRVIDYASRYNSDRLEDEYDMMGFYITDTLLYQKKSLLKNKLSFQFTKNGEFRTYEGKELRLTGEWKLSPSGSQIILWKGFGPSNYIDIISLSPDKLVIGKMDRFAIKTKLRDEQGYVEYYYKLELSH